MSDCYLATHSNSNFTTVNSHEALDKLATTLVSAQAQQAAIQLIYDTIGYLQGKEDNDKRFKSQNKFTGRTGNYDSTKKLRSKHIRSKVEKIVKVDEDGNEVADDEENADDDPLDDEDKNPCIQHPYLHKSMMQGGGLEVEIIQEPDPRYEECYDRQRERQKREELRELCRFNFLYGITF